MELLEEAAITAHPSPTRPCYPPLSFEEKIKAIESHFAQIMELLELDLTDPSLAKTPHRVAKMYVEELFSGLSTRHFPDISYLENEFIGEGEGMILVKEIEVKSICEHHFVPFIGKARVAYLPKNKVLGLSKINRIVQYFCRRPQLQERLTAQIADSLQLILGTEDVAVSIVAEHFCVKMRGVSDESSTTLTQILKGAFQTNPLIRQDFFR
jgi:GTP cyclohydrolase I